MAEIQEYVPQTSAQEPVGGVSPNIELAGSVGRSIEKIGGSLEEAGTLIHRREAQKQSADVYEGIAYQRSNSTQDLQQHIQNGTLDVDKFMDSYDQQVTDAGSKITTPEARNLYDRQSSRLRGYLLKMANAGASQVAYNEDLGKRQQGVNTNSNTIETSSDPLGTFKDVYDSELENIQHSIDTGSLKESSRSKAEMEMGSKYAESAIRGMADISPDKARQALHSADSPLIKFLSPDQRHKMEMEINKAERDKQTDQSQALRAHKEAQEAGYMAWSQKNAMALENNQLTTKDTAAAQSKGILTAEQKERWDQWIDKRQNKDFKTDPKDYNDIARRVIDHDADDHIDDIDTLNKEALAKKISATGSYSIQSLQSLMAKTPEEKQFRQNEKSLFDQAKKQIEFKDGLGNWSLQGAQKLARFKADYAIEKQKSANPRDLSDPTNPMYFGNRLESYKTTIEDQFKFEQEQRTNKANEGNKDARKPGENIDDWKKRTGRK